jgi:hypothetical protein
MDARHGIEIDTGAQRSLGLRFINQRERRTVQWVCFTRVGAQRGELFGSMVTCLPAVMVKPGDDQVGETRLIDSECDRQSGDF